MAHCPDYTYSRCRELVSGNLNWTWRPDSNLQGIYVIKDKSMVIYVGHAGDIRKRLNQHFSNSGIQEIDKYLRSLSYRYKATYITVYWIYDPFHKCNEHCYVNGVKKIQGKRPTYNMQRGNSCT